MPAGKDKIERSRSSPNKATRENMFIPFALALISLPVTVQGRPKPCPENTRYIEIPGVAKEAKRGRCEQCPSCDGGGFVMNNTLPRDYNKRYGFLSCHPCDPCPPRYFREAHSFPVCNMCSKNCSAVNRFESQPCGGSSPGHCGECLPGFKAISSSAEVMCIERPEPPRPELKDITLAANLLEVPLASGSLHVNVSAQARIDANDMIGVIGGVLVLIMAGGVLIWCKRRKHTKTYRRSPTASADPNIGASGAPLVCSNTTPDDVVEIDGIENKNVRGEIQVTSIDKHPGLTHGRCPLEIKLPNWKLDKTDKFTTDCFMCVSKKLSPKKRNDLFHILGLDECDYLSEEELWKTNSANHPHAYFVYDVLVVWLQRNYPNANLPTLGDALIQADCGLIVDELAHIASQHVHHTQPKQVS